MVVGSVMYFSASTNCWGAFLPSFDGEGADYRLTSISCSLMIDVYMGTLASVIPILRVTNTMVNTLRFLIYILCCTILDPISLIFFLKEELMLMVCAVRVPGSSPIYPCLIFCCTYLSLQLKHNWFLLSRGLLYYSKHEKSMFICACFQILTSPACRHLIV